MNNTESNLSVDHFIDLMGFTLGETNKNLISRLGPACAIIEHDGNDLQRDIYHTYTEAYNPFLPIDISLSYLMPKNIIISINLEVFLEINKYEYISSLRKKGLWDKKCELIGCDKSKVIKVLGDQFEVNPCGIQYPSSFGLVKFDFLENGSERCTGISTIKFPST